jgi:dinuclear metal center YbgI/SA1388 family protein
LGIGLAMQLLLADIVSVLEHLAPPALAEAWDNVGLQIGDPRRPVRSVWVALDPGPDVVGAACSAQVDLLVTHHPLFFHPIKRIAIDTPLGGLIEQALRHGLAIYCLHTNLDAVADGLNHLLARRIGLRQLRPLTVAPGVTASSRHGIGRIGTLAKAMPLADLAQSVKRQLGAATVRMAGDPGLRVRQVAVASGSGGSLVGDFLKSSAEAYISGDLRYHEVRDIQYARRGVVDVGHFHSEHLMTGAVAERLRRAFGRRHTGLRVQACPLEKDPFATV